MRFIQGVTATVLGVAVGFGAISAVASTTIAAPTATYADVAGLEQALQIAAQKIQDNDPQAERIILTSVVASPVFPQLSPELQHTNFTLLAGLELKAGDFADALVHAQQASQSKYATALDWSLRLRAGYAGRDWADCVASLRTIAERWPNTLDRFRGDAVINVLGQARKPSMVADGGYGLLSALFDAGWRPAQMFERPDDYWGELVRFEVDRGNLDRALKIAELIEDPYVLIGLRADKRDDALVARDPARFDPMRGAGVALTEAHQAMADNPNRLAAVNSYVEALRQQGRDAEALQVVDAALARALPADGSATTFTDPGEVNWTEDNRTTLLVRLGRFDDAIAEARDAARRPEFGQLNVNQTINLGDLLTRLGRPQEAKEAIADVSARNINEYGRLVADQVGVCADAELGRLADAKATLAEMAEHARAWGGEKAYADALFCVGDLDQLATMYIKRLADPELRTAALRELQTYDAELPATPYGRMWDQRMTALKRRPDLRAAIEEVGRIETWRLMPPET